MWLVMQVVSGREGHTVLLMERLLSGGVLEKCFVPMRRMKKKYQGSWKEITEKLFPGYVFLISKQPQLLYDELKRIPALTKLLGSCEEYFTPLSEDDVRLLRGLQDMQDPEKEPNRDWIRCNQQETPAVGLSREWSLERRIRLKLSPDRLRIWKDGLRRSTSISASQLWRRSLWGISR